MKHKNYVCTIEPNDTRYSLGKVLIGREPSQLMTKNMSNLGVPPSKGQSPTIPHGNDYGTEDIRITFFSPFSRWTCCNGEKLQVAKQYLIILTTK